MSDSTPKQSGKGKPTPPRKVSQAQRKKPLVGDRSKEAKAAQRAKLREERNKAREGMMSGDEKYLTVRDRGPQRKFARDLVDSRFTAGELVLPALFVVVLLTFVDSMELQVISLFAMWGLFAVVAFDGWLISRAVKKAAATKFGSEKLEGGLGWYAAMRSIQMRTMRIPKPQVKRFAKVK